MDPTDDSKATDVSPTVSLNLEELDVSDRVTSDDFDDNPSSSQHTDYRTIYVNEPNPQYPTNRISNTKYTILSFIPKNLLEQFGEFYNIYFLIIALLQLDSDITPVDPISTWLPLITVFALSALKELYDDLRRKRSDQRANSALFSVIDNGRLYLKMSQDICVGNIIYLPAESEVPCDLVLLSCSEPDGTCFLQTTNLDGESDFKPRKVASSSLSMEQAKLFRGIVHCEHPNQKIYEFKGRLQQDNSTNHIPLSQENLLLQGCHLRNTSWVYGVAVYTGNETKLGQNKIKTQTKRTHQDQFISRASAAIFCFQLLLTLIFGIIGNIWQIKYANDHWYLDYSSPDTAWEYFVVPLRFLLLNSTMIPISLKVTLDFIKYFYAKFIEWDIKLYDQDADAPALATSTKVCEDLGQIEIICSDKTGTITQNSMTFSKCTIGDVLYSLPNVQEYEDELEKDVKAGSEQTIEFLAAMALCNTIKPTIEEDEIIYHSSSPDEEALVNAAAERGVTLLKSNTSVIEISISGKVVQYKKLALLPFTSDRKRMSVVLKRADTGEVVLYTKGADDVLKSRLAKPQSFASESYLKEFASQGLRTLIFAKKNIRLNEFEQWEQKYQKAASSMVDRESKIEKCYQALETKLFMMGVTAIEDKLQEYVSDCMHSLREAGIQLWILTGDRPDTATQTGINCNLIQVHEKIVPLEGSDLHSITDSINNFKTSFTYEKPALVLTGGQLEYAVQHPDFVEVCLTQTTNVIVARATPNQKAQVVELLRKKKKTVLAIGDGGNDVAMIQKANVGVAVYGKEGLQASRAADYSIGKFHYLKRLLLVHGRYAFNRTAFVVQYSFYKSMLICFIQILYQFQSGFSGTSFFNTFSLTFYNIVFTSAPVAFYILDKDIPEEKLMDYPRLYSFSQKGLNLTAKSFGGWVCTAMYQSLIVFLMTIFLGGTVQSPSVPVFIDYTSIFSIAYTSLLFIDTIMIILESHRLTTLNLVAIFGSLVAYFFSQVILNFIPSNLQYSLVENIWSSAGFWAIVLLQTTVAILPFLLVKYIKENWLVKDFRRSLDSPLLTNKNQWSPFDSLLPDSPNWLGYSSKSSLGSQDSPRSPLPLNEYSFKRHHLQESHSSTTRLLD